MAMAFSASPSCNTIITTRSPSASFIKSSSSSSSAHASIPMMEPFSRSRISRSIPEPSLIQKAEHAISDRCSILEGDDAYKCWEALFEFENLKDEYTKQCEIAASSEKQRACRPLERLENVVRQSGGVKSLIDNVRVLAMLKELQSSSGDGAVASANEEIEEEEEASSSSSSSSSSDLDLVFFPEAGALPPSVEELELERSARMPDSPVTRMLRRMGNPSSWFSTTTPNSAGGIEAL